MDSIEYASCSSLLSLFRVILSRDEDRLEFAEASGLHRDLPLLVGLLRTFDFVFHLNYAIVKNIPSVLTDQSSCQENSDGSRMESGFSLLENVKLLRSQNRSVF